MQTLYALEAVRLTLIPYLVPLETALAILGFVIYIYAIVKDRNRWDPEAAKPNKSTWVVWTVLQWLVAGTMLQAHALSNQIAIYALGDLIVVVLALRYGLPAGRILPRWRDWETVDRWSLLGAFAGIIVWCLTCNSLAGMVIGLAIVTIGSGPTYVKVWHHPKKESLLAWYVATATSFCASLAIPQWTWEDALPPVCYLLVQASMTAVMLRPHRAVIAVKA